MRRHPAPFFGWAVRTRSLHVGEDAYDGERQSIDAGVGYGVAVIAPALALVGVVALANRPPRGKQLFWPAERSPALYTYMARPP